MASLADIGKFEAFNFKGMKKQIGHDPWRLLIGSGDRYSTSMWNKILGRHDDPIVDQFGGAASQRYGQAEKAGIDTTAGRNMHTVARAIALFEAGGGGGGEAGGGAAGAGEAGGAAGGADGVVVGGVNGGGEVVTTGLGPATGGSGSGGLSAASKMGNWQNLMGQMQMQGQQQADQPGHRAELNEQDPYLTQQMVGGSTLSLSSKKLKTPGGLADAAINRGMQLKNPVDANGVQILMIQQISKQLAKAKATLDAIERSRAKRG